MPLDQDEVRVSFTAEAVCTVTGGETCPSLAASPVDDIAYT